MSLIAPLAAPAIAIPLPVPLPFQGIDGLTALTHSQAGVGDTVFTRDADGNYDVEVTLYSNAGGSWHQVSAVATLRVFAQDFVNGKEYDRVSKTFTSSAVAPVVVTFPGDAVIDTHTFDLFVTFSCPSCPGAWPTSHHSPQKNLLIEQGQFDLAETFDYTHLVPVIGL